LASLSGIAVLASWDIQHYVEHEYILAKPIENLIYKNKQASISWLGIGSK
jgi:hypothetical protein